MAITLFNSITTEID